MVIVYQGPVGDVSRPNRPAHELLACEWACMDFQTVSSKLGLYSQHPCQIVGPTCYPGRHRSDDFRACSVFRPQRIEHAALIRRDTKQSPVINRESDVLAREKARFNASWYLTHFGYGFRSLRHPKNRDTATLLATHESVSCSIMRVLPPACR